MEHLSKQTFLLHKSFFIVLQQESKSATQYDISQALFVQRFVCVRFRYNSRYAFSSFSPIRASCLPV